MASELHSNSFCDCLCVYSEPQQLFFICLGQKQLPSLKFSEILPFSPHCQIQCESSLQSSSRIPSLLRLASSHTPDPAPLTATESALNQILCAKLAAQHKLCKCVTWWHSLMSQKHGVKGGATDEAFRKQRFCGREELLLVWTFKIFYMRRNLYNTQKEKA